jgi:methionyl-tRNA formyltransferase
MRIVFLGYQTWGHGVLAALLASRHEVSLVITHPASEHPYETIWNDSVADLAAAHGVPGLVRRSANDDDTVARLRAIAPDLLVSADWRTWVAPTTYECARHGAINIHDALLPRYGGFAPLNWALANGETQVGVTVHFMNEFFDLGDIVVQRAVPVEPRDTVTDLFHKTMPLFAPLALEAIELIETGGQTWIRQDPQAATFFHKRSIEDSRIDWRSTAREIANLIRAQVDPYPNAFAYYGQKRLRILAASVSDRRFGGTPGRVFCRDGKSVVVVCGPRARAGTEAGLTVEQVRTEDNLDLQAGEFFTAMGGYLTSYPSPPDSRATRG